MTHGCKSTNASTAGGTTQVISVDVRDATAHGRSPMATTPESPSWSSVMMYSKPWPANVRSVPPPAEPKLGERPVITLACSKVTSLATSASPKEGRDTVTACTPGGALDTSHCQGAIQTVEPLSSLQSFTHTSRARKQAVGLIPFLSPLGWWSHRRYRWRLGQSTGTDRTPLQGLAGH